MHHSISSITQTSLIALVLFQGVSVVAMELSHTSNPWYYQGNKASDSKMSLGNPAYDKFMCAIFMLKPALLERLLAEDSSLVSYTFFKRVKDEQPVDMLSLLVLGALKNKTETVTYKEDLVLILKMLSRFVAKIPVNKVLLQELLAVHEDIRGCILDTPFASVLQEQKMSSNAARRLEEVNMLWGAFMRSSRFVRSSQYKRAAVHIVDANGPDESGLLSSLSLSTDKRLSAKPTP